MLIYDLTKTDFNHTYCKCLKSNDHTEETENNQNPTIFKTRNELIYDFNICKYLSSFLVTEFCCQMNICIITYIQHDIS